MVRGLPVGASWGSSLFSSGCPDRKQFFLVGTILRTMLPRVKVVIGFPQEIIWRRRADGARRSEIGRHEPALDVFHVDQVRQIVDQRAKKVVLLCERFLGPLSLTDVTARFDDVAHLTRFIENRRRADLDEGLLAFRVVVRVHRCHGGLGGDNLTQRAGLVFPRAWQVTMVRELMARQAGRGVDSSGLLAGGAIGQDDAVVVTNDQHDVGNGVNHRLQEGPRPPDRLLRLLAIDGVMDCLADRRGVGLTFDQIILRAAAHCLPCYDLIGHAGEHHDRQVRRSGRKPANRLQSVRVGQR